MFGSAVLAKAVASSTKPKMVVEYDRSKILGNGTFATVFWGTLNGEPVAVKRIELHKLNEKFKDREEAAMRKMYHDNVLKLMEVQENSDFKLLILDQISDFGVSKPIQPTGSFSANSGAKGTKRYFAPEYLRLERQGDQSKEERKIVRADKSIDTFSLGCLFYSYIVKKGSWPIHLFATPGKEYISKDTYDYDVTENILANKKFLKENGLPSEHYAFDMIDGMTKAKSDDRWCLNKTVMETLKREKHRRLD